MNTISKIAQPWWAQDQATLYFVDGGREAPGLDCFGYLRLVYARELGIDLPAWPGVSRRGMVEASTDLFDAQFHQDFSSVETGFEAAFDAAVIRKPQAVGGWVRMGWWHVGIITRPGHLVHLDSAQGVVEVAWRDTPRARHAADFKPSDVRVFRHKERGTPDLAQQVLACA